MRRGKWSVDFSSYTDPLRREPFDIFHHISQYNADRTHERISENRCPGTTNWILDAAPFRAWLAWPNGGCFVLTGIVGSGKTIMTTSVVEYLQDMVTADQRQIFHFFYETSFQNRLAGVDVLEAFIKQMIVTNPDLPLELQQRVWTFYGPQSGRPDLGELSKRLFLPLARHLKNALFVIDGIDECEPQSRRELVLLLSQLVTEGSSLYVSTRDSSEWDRLMTNFFIAECSTREAGVRRDLEVFLSSLIEERLAYRRITENEKVLIRIKSTILEKASAMFLWVKLLIIEIWTVCNDDDQIQDYLESRLPADLQETYSRCRARVHESKAQLSMEMFRLVCGAVEPFHINELRAFLALGESDGKLIAARGEPSTEVLMKDCAADLLTMDQSGLVLPIHHSVQQHVFRKEDYFDEPHSGESFYGYGPKRDLREKVSVELMIGFACMLYISQRTQRALIKTQSSSRNQYDSLSTMSFQPLAFVRKWFEKPDGKTKQIATKVLQPPPPLVDLVEDQALFAYAQRSWVQSNRYLYEITEAVSSRSRPLFSHLVSQARYGVAYPWPKFATSHLHGLFTWAVTHEHLPLLYVISNPPWNQDAKRLELFDRPLLPPDEGFALHYAARTRNVVLFKLLWDHADRFKEDVDGDTPLHIGAQAGCAQVTYLYAALITLPSSLGVAVRGSGAARASQAAPLLNRNRQNPLHMAMMSGKLQCVTAVMALADALTNKFRSLQNNARQTGYSFMWDSSKDINGNSPFEYAAAVPNDDFLLQCIDYWSEQGLDLSVPLLESTRAAFQLQRWSLCNSILKQKSFAIGYPFAGGLSLPSVSRPLPESLIATLVHQRPLWTPQILDDSWKLGRMQWRDAMMTLSLPITDLLVKNSNLILLGLCQAIVHGRRDQFRSLVDHVPDGIFKFADWPSVIAIEALTANHLDGIHFALSKAEKLHPFVLNGAARSHNRYMIQRIEKARSCVVPDPKFWSVEAEDAAKRGEVAEFFVHRRAFQLAIITPVWLRAIASFTDIPEPKRMGLLPGLPETAAVADGVLWYASLNGYTGIASEMLDKYSANIDFRGQHETTPLWQATRYGHWETVALLLSRGADGSLKNLPIESKWTHYVYTQPMTPYELAKDTHGSEVPQDLDQEILASLHYAQSGRVDSFAVPQPPRLPHAEPSVDHPPTENEQVRERSPRFGSYKFGSAKSSAWPPIPLKLGRASALEAEGFMTPKMAKAKSAELRASAELQASAAGAAGCSGEGSD